ncbi:MAG: hypothetical protein QME71_01570 [Dehalococcoidia bacterium]|nr:hypothetical protein [Dehalococcoidia bacterium]
MRLQNLGLGLAVLLLGVTFLSCGEEDGTPAVPASATSSPRPAATTPAALGTMSPVAGTPTLPDALPENGDADSPAAGAVGCAAGLTAELRDIDGAVAWDVYCPTYLPPGYERELVGGPDPLEIRIVNPATGSRIYFVQSLTLGLAAATALTRSEGELVGEAGYGDFDARLFRSRSGAPHGPFTALVAQPPPLNAGAVPLHYIEGYGVSEDEMRDIGESMRKVGDLP